MAHTWQWSVSVQVKMPHHCVSRKQKWTVDHWTCPHLCMPCRLMCRSVIEHRSSFHLISSVNEWFLLHENSTENNSPRIRSTLSFTCSSLFEKELHLFLFDGIEEIHIISTALFFVEDLWEKDFTIIRFLSTFEDKISLLLIFWCSHIDRFVRIIPRAEHREDMDLSFAYVPTASGWNEKDSKNHSCTLDRQWNQTKD